MTKSPLEKKDSVMIPGLIQVFNIHFGSHIDEVLLLFGMMVSFPAYTPRVWHWLAQ